MKKAIKEGYIKLGGYRIGVVVLEDGQRLITEEGMKQFMMWLEDGEPDNDDAKNFAFDLEKGNIIEND